MCDELEVASQISREGTGPQTRLPCILASRKGIQVEQKLCWNRVLLRCSVLLASAVLGAQAQTPDTSSLNTRAQAIISQHHGKVALFAQNLRTGETLGIDPDQTVQTASTIKLTILFDAMEQVRSGSVHLEDPITLRKDDQVGGSGILQFFDTPLNLTLRDVLMLMITQSDNTATNLAIDKLGLDNINTETQKLGLKDTWLYKKISKPATEPMPPDQKIYGLGKTYTPRDSRIGSANVSLPVRRLLSVVLLQRSGSLHHDADHAAKAVLS